MSKRLWPHKRRLSPAQLSDIRRRARPIWNLGFGLNEAVQMAWEGYESRRERWSGRQVSGASWCDTGTNPP